MSAAVNRLFRPNTSADVDQVQVNLENDQMDEPHKEDTKLLVCLKH